VKPRLEWSHRQRRAFVVIANDEPGGRRTFGVWYRRAVNRCAELSNYDRRADAKLEADRLQALKDCLWLAVCRGEHVAAADEYRRFEADPSNWTDAAVAVDSVHEKD
jgi:hypothetical protein